MAIVLLGKKKKKNIKHCKQSDYILAVLKWWLGQPNGLQIGTFKANQNKVAMFYVAFTFNI